MRKQLKRHLPASLWQNLKWIATVLGLHTPRAMLTDADISMLKKWGQGRRELAEIGVFEGGSAVILRQVMNPGGALTLIDPYITDSLSEMRGSYRVARWAVNRVRRGRVQFVRGFSYEVVKEWKTPLDFLFIDGDHREAACRQDFDQWERHLSREGVILFHDARLGQPSEQPWMGAEGPTKVVNDLFRNQSHPRWRIIDEGGSIVVIGRA